MIHEDEIQGIAYRFIIQSTKANDEDMDTLVQDAPII